MNLKICSLLFKGNFQAPVNWISPMIPHFTTSLLKYKTFWFQIVLLLLVYLMSPQYYILKMSVCHPNGLQFQPVSFLVCSNNAHQSIKQKGEKNLITWIVLVGKPEVGFAGWGTGQEFYVNFMKWHVVFRIAIHVLIRYPKTLYIKHLNDLHPTHLPPAQRSSRIPKAPSIRYLVFTSKATINIPDTYTLSETVSITISSVHHH